MSLGMTYLRSLTIALLIGFLVAAGIIRLKPSLAFIGYILAGFAAVVALHVIMKAVLGPAGIAVRGPLGLVSQGLQAHSRDGSFQNQTGRPCRHKRR